MSKDMQFIDLKEALADLKKEVWWSDAEKVHIRRFLKNQKVVEAEPVVHGFWKSKGNKLECSVCSHRAYLGTEDPGIHEEEKKVRNYCFHCGAMMNLREEYV